VAFNYRLGTLGFMFGPKFNESGGVANAGLYDQELVLQWIQQNIHLFGGDPTRVTVIGQSAGGGSIIFQTLNSPALFSQAIAFSPAFLPNIPVSQQDATFEQFLGILGVSSLEAARNLSSEAVIDANYLLVAASAYGQIAVGPVVDGNIIPSDPHRMVLEGRSDRNVKLITSFASDEGLIFTPPNITTDQAFSEYVGSYFPSASQVLLDFISTELYPPSFDGSLPYTSQFERAQLFFAEIISICNTGTLSHASFLPSHAIEFDVFPGAHGQDIPYIFFNGLGSEGPSSTYDDFNVTIAEIMQGYITSFAETGDPNSGNGATGAPFFAPYDFTHVQRLSNDGIGLVDDQTVNKRCDFWQLALYN